MNTRFLTIYDTTKRTELESLTTTTTSTTKRENFKSNDEEFFENRKSFRVNHNLNLKEPLHGTRTILKVKAMPNDSGSIEKNSIQKHEINSFSRSLSSYNINNYMHRPLKCNRKPAYCCMSANPYIAVNLPIKRMDVNHCNPAHTTTATNPYHEIYYDPYHNQNRSTRCTNLLGISSTNASNIQHNPAKQSKPSFQLDLEINTPRNDIKISRKCKSYEVR
jgi:hypothetical protein